MAKAQQAPSRRTPSTAQDGDPTDAVRAVVFAPVRGEGLVQQTVKRLADAIRLGLLEKDERLPRESELARRLDISPMTLREAFAVLREAGWLRTTRGRGGGTFVTRRGAAARSTAVSAEELSFDYLTELTSLRRAISGEASALAAERATPDEVDQIEHLASATGWADGEFSMRHFRWADASLHILIAITSGSNRIATAEAEIQVELDRVITAALPHYESLEVTLRPSMTEHAQLARAIRDRDPQRARSIMRAHVSGTRDLLLSVAPPIEEK
jgi:DNA-binding FadR family transcriptional regulator